MSSQKQPKVLLFDIGGVCVLSPFQSILDYELSLGIPPGWINYSISKTAPNGYWHRLETGSIHMDDAFFAGFNKDLHDPTRWEVFYRTRQIKDPALPREVPPVPKVDGRWLFHDMMNSSQSPDPWMFPALQNLKASGRYMLAALSNTVIFPPGHELHEPDYFSNPLRRVFDVFISSAHVGMRKPDPRIYQLALQETDKFARQHASDREMALEWQNGIKAEDIVFLDDIGENLKAARKEGFRTVKVTLGRAYEAVEELERITGLQLAGEHPKVPIRPRRSLDRAKI